MTKEEILMEGWSCRRESRGGRSMQHQGRASAKVTPHEGTMWWLGRAAHPARQGGSQAQVAAALASPLPAPLHPVSSLRPRPCSPLTFPSACLHKWCCHDQIDSCARHEDVPQFLRSGLVQWWKSTADGHQRKPWLSSFESSNEPLPEGSPCDYIREWYKVFRFEECWLKLEGLEDLVASAWDKNLRRNEAIRTFHAKPRTAVALKKWNKEISA